MKDWIKNLLSDERGSISTKRVIALVSAFFLCITLIANSFSELNKAPSEALVYAVSALAFGCLGLTTAEKIFKKNEQ